MIFEKYIPNDLLKSFVQSFLIIESENGMRNRILPGSSVVLSFRIRGTIISEEEKNENAIPLLGIAGLRRQARTIHYSKAASVLLAVFREAGAAAFFKEPMHEIFGLNLSLDHLVGRVKIQEIEERLLEAKTNQQRISIVESFLVSELKEQRPDPLVLDSIRKIRLVSGNLKIQDLVKGMPISRDSYEKKFRRIVGTTPKQFSEIVRMRNLIERYSPDTTFTDTAHEAGYFDQAHFIKEFKSFTGQTPKTFFKSSYW